MSQLGHKSLISIFVVGTIIMGTFFAAFAAEPVNEVPMFEELVKSGELPAMKDRLPKDPFVVGPGVLMPEEWVDQWTPGKYGGTLNQKADFPTGFLNIAGGATFLRAPSQYTENPLPNLLSDIHISEDNREFTLVIREGLKWSDGVPVTTEDIRFTIEDIYFNKDAGRPLPNILYTQGDTNMPPVKLTIVDDYTFVLTFEKPYGMFIASLCSWIPYYDFMLKPAHYLKQFHGDYANSEELERLLEENNETEWANLLAKKDVAHWDVGTDNALGMPVLNAWVLTERDGQRTIYTRNPYFHHVDPLGQQLPYIDRVVVEEVTDREVVLNMVMAGNVQIGSGGEFSLRNMPVYVQNAERAGYDVFLTGCFNFPPLLFFNHDYEYDIEGSLWQELMQDPQKRFGRAVAAAIDPYDINETIFYNMYGDPFWNNLEHNPELALELLNEIGFTRKDNEGFFLSPDGEFFSLDITVIVDQRDMVPVAELVKEHLEDVGIRVRLDIVGGNLYDQRLNGNQMMASMNWNDGPAWPSGISEDFLPHEKGGWSPMTWRYFITEGETGRKPPEYIQEFYDLYVRRKEFVPGSEEGVAAWQKLEQWLIDNYVFIPLTGPAVQPNILHSGLRNVPNELSQFDLDTYIAAEQYWYEYE